MGIAEKIRSRRKQLGLTMQDVADYVGVNKATVLKWENGKIETVRLDKVEKLAMVLQVDPLSLVHDDDELKEKKYPDFAKMELGEIESGIVEMMKKMSLSEKISIYNYVERMYASKQEK